MGLRSTHRKAAHSGHFIYRRAVSSPHRAAPKPNSILWQTTHRRLVVRASDVDDELAAVSAAVEVSIRSPQIRRQHCHASVSN